MTVSGQRRLAAVWFADIAGYTALASTNEDSAMRTVALFQRVARSVVEADRGQLVKFLGDGALAAFETAGSAVRAAARLREAYASAAGEEGVPGELRIGVHLGEIVTAADGDVYGDGVNVASRLQAAAARGEILASEDVWRQLRRREGFALEPAGERTLKGIADPMATYRVTEVAGLEIPSKVGTAAETAVPTARSRRRKALSLLGIGGLAALVAVGASTWFLGRGGGAGTVDASVAVLPFQDMSAGSDQEYFVDGLTEEILNALSQVPDLRVAARTSSFAYKGREVDIRQVAHELGVAAVLEGSVRRDDDHLRITAQLIKASDGFHLWSETYDRELESVFAVQEEIAEAIAKELKGTLGLASGQQLVRNRTGDMGAYELYLEARADQRIRGEGVERAIGLYERALERDPTFAPAWAGLAEAWSLTPYYHADADSAYWAESLDRSEEAADKALELDSSLVSAYVALGNAHRDRWDWAESGRYYRRALELAPEDPEANQQYAEMLAGMGRTKEAIPYARRAVELDPLAAVRLNVLGYILKNDGRYDESMAAVSRAFAIDSTLSVVRETMIRLLVSRGRYAETEAFMERIGTPVDSARRRMIRAIAAGDTATAIRIYRSDTGSANDYLLPVLAGDRDGMFAALERGPNPRGVPFGTPYLLWDSMFEPVRTDPRFPALVRRVNLEPR